MTTVDITYLKEINQSIKCINCRPGAYQALNAIDTGELDTGLRMYYYYLKGKHWELRHKREPNMDFLEKANKCYDQISLEADNGGVAYRNPKFIFKRAWVKYQLSLLATDADDRYALVTKALELVNYGLKLHPTNGSLCFLKVQLSKRPDRS